MGETKVKVKDLPTKREITAHFNYYLGERGKVTQIIERCKNSIVVEFKIAEKQRFISLSNGVPVYAQVSFIDFKEQTYCIKIEKENFAMYLRYFNANKSEFLK